MCIGALVLHWYFEKSHDRRTRVLRGVTVFMAALLLFPSISISDDYARARLADAKTPSPVAFVAHGLSNTSLLAMQLEETEHIRPVVPFVFILTLCSFLVVLLETSDSICLFRGGTRGRAPPAF
jgi:hypothetical protein